ncbi:MAG: hypothetical protein H7122_11975 [Chitinophagaceae bacterium]|nr:hypothetical protein [Chitinophagaceae bacterium]
MNQFIPSVIRGFLSEKLLELHYWLQRGIAQKSYQPVYLPLPARKVDRSKNNH